MKKEGISWLHYIGFVLLAFVAFSINFFQHKTPYTNSPIDYFMWTYTKNDEKTLLPETETINEFRRINKEYSKNLPPDIPINIINEFYDSIGSDAILTVLEENPLCHEEAHNVGRAIYQRTNNFTKAFAICGLRCGQGCFHGILMESISKYNTKDPLVLSEFFFDESSSNQTFKDFIQALCPIVKTTQGVHHVQCYHGLGHALMDIADYNLSLGIEYCKFLKTKGDIFYCTTGVFMEYTLAYGSDDSGLYPCDIYLDFPAACFRYKFGYGSKSLKILSKQIDLCSSLEGHQRLGCFYGIGHAYQNFLIKQEITLNQLCSSGSNEDKKMCIDGTIVSLAFYDEKSAIKLCSTLRGEFKEHCLDDIKIKDAPLNRSFENYYYIAS